MVEIITDPEVLEAQAAADKLFKVYRSVEDPGTKEIFKKMVFDALEFRKEIRIKSEARELNKLLRPSNSSFSKS